MSRVRWTDQAVEDLREIRRFIERDSPRYARLVAERLVAATERLEDFPRSGRVVPELQRDDIREIVVGAYRVVYLLEPGIATLITVFRSSRLLPTSLLELGESSKV